MTLADWNSAVPRVALEAVLIGSTQERTEVERGIESLVHYSLAEERVTPTDRQDFIIHYLWLPTHLAEESCRLAFSDRRLKQMFRFFICSVQVRQLT